jgi:acetyl esterase/lipase
MPMLACLVSVLVPLAAPLQDAPPVVHLWANGVPGFEKLKDEPEQAKDWWVKNIHNPSLTVYLPPKELANGTGIIVVPGGGLSQLVVGAEGTEPAKWLNSLGIAAFVLKHRLPREPNSPYKIETALPEDGFRAIRVLRQHAAEWGVNPDRIGMLGFSAGGEVVSSVAFRNTVGDASAADPIDRLSGKLNFAMEIYPGPVGVPAAVPADSPPMFMLVSNDDGGHSEVVIDLLQKYRAAKVQVEAHVLAQGGHGFNMGQRSNLVSVKTWSQRLADWLADSGWLKKTP